MDTEECNDCGAETDLIELQMHDGCCKCCYDDYHFQISNSDEEDD